MSDPTLAELRAAVVARYPDLSEARFTLHTKGWDSLAVDADDRLIFKFPRDADAEASLRLEARLLAILRPVLAMPVPDLAFVEGPPPFSRHTKLPGEHLVTSDYERLSVRDRDALADALGLFYAQLHALDHDAMRAAGARRVEAWLGPDAIRAQAWPLLPDALRPLAERALAIWQDLPPDPHGETYGYFDGHGWNMAFDHANGRLNGVYDFGDSGFGDVHQEFVYSNFISNDLTARIVAAYERHARRELDHARIDVLTGAFRLHELAKADDDRAHLAFSLDQFKTWASWPRGF